jgi:hypothetical protein
MNSNRNARAYMLLFAIHSHLTEKYHVPEHIHESYRRTIIYILPFYKPNPDLHEQLRKSIALRNEVCHFKLISMQELSFLESLSRNLRMTQYTKAGM